MTQFSTIWLVANSASGSNSEEAVSDLEGTFAAAGLPIARRISFPDEPAPAPAQLDEAGVDLVVIFTGDGTVNAVVTGLYGWDGAVLVLPGGTMNILAKRLHGEEAEPAGIVARVAAGQSRRTRPNVVRSRYGDGLSGVQAGPGTAWNHVREAMREVDVLGTISTAADAIGESTGGAMVVCREPGCGRPEGYALVMITPVEDGLELKGYYAQTIGDYAKSGMALLRRNFREGPHDLLGIHPTAHLFCPDGEVMGMAVDGEAHDGESAESFVPYRCEVDLLATADAG